MGEVFIRAKVDEGVSLVTTDGTPLHLAIVDANGNVLSSGAEVSAAVFRASLKAYDEFWQGNGHMSAMTPISLP